MLRSNTQRGFHRFLTTRFQQSGEPPANVPGGGQPADPATPPAAPPNDPPTPKTYTEAEWNAMAADRRKEQKRLKELEDAAKAREDADKSESQKATERAEAAERELAKARRDNLTTKVGAKHQLPADLWGRLQGETEEEIEADAAKIAALVKSAAPQPGHTGNPPDGGKPPAQSKKAELEAQLGEATKNGDALAVLRIKRELTAIK